MSLNRGRVGRRIGLWACCAIAASWVALAGAALAVNKPSADPFYDYNPGAIAGAQPGTILKSRAVSVPTLGVMPFPFLPALQALYRTQNQLGEPTATVATIIAPPTPGPTKLLSYQTYYDGLDDSCRPSYTLQGGVPPTGSGNADNSLLLNFVRQGYTVVASDYEGPTDDYTAGRESGAGTLDGIRAAQSKLGLPASTPVGLIGYSGGSIASEWASELAPSYAPGLNIIGVAEGGIPANYADMLAYINGSPSWSGVIPALALGLVRAYGLNPWKYFNPIGLAVLSQVAKGCITPSAYPGIRLQDLLKPQYRNWQQDRDLAWMFNDAIMGAAGTPKGPLLMAIGKSDGGGDGVVPEGDVTALAHSYCRQGVSVQLHAYAGHDHVASLGLFQLDAARFMQQRFAGVMPANECASIGPGSPLTPLPAASWVLAHSSSGSPPPATKPRKCGKRKQASGKRKCGKKPRREARPR